MVASGNGLIRQARAALESYKPCGIINDGAAVAAVLIILYQKQGEPHVLLTKRSHKVEYHKGEISFPGGSIESEDPDLVSTALREAFEEVGVRPGEVEVIGQLDDLITITNFKVTPYVGVLIADDHHEFVLEEEEVVSVVEVPLRHLLDDKNVEMELRQFQDQPVLVPVYIHDGQRIWGATAKMLQQLLAIIS